MEIKGNIKKIYETVQVSEKFAKREFVVTTNDVYPQDIIFQVTQDKCGLLDKYKEGSNVAVSINIRGREWVSPKGEIKYFNTIEGWRIEEDTQEQNGTTQPTKQEDDLPF